MDSILWWAFSSSSVPYVLWHVILRLAQMAYQIEIDASSTSWPFRTVLISLWCPVLDRKCCRKLDPDHRCCRTRFRCLSAASSSSASSASSSSGMTTSSFRQMNSFHHLVPCLDAFGGADGVVCGHDQTCHNVDHDGDLF